MHSSGPQHSRIFIYARLCRVAENEAFPVQIANGLINYPLAE